MEQTFSIKLKDENNGQNYNKTNCVRCTIFLQMFWPVD